MIEILKLPEVIGAFFGAFFAVLIGVLADITKNHVTNWHKKRKKRVTVLKLIYQDLENINEHIANILKYMAESGNPKGYLQKIPLDNWYNLKNSEEFTQFLEEELFMDINEKMRQIELVNKVLDDYYTLKEQKILDSAIFMYHEIIPARILILMEIIESELNL